MSLFIPTHYAAQILTELRAKLVGMALTNQNYTGEITRNGDTVKVYAVGDLAVNDHVRGQKINYQSPSGSEVTMVIDQEKDCSFLIDDVDAFQSAVNVRNAYAAKAIRAQLEVTDTFILNKVADADPNNVITTTASTASGFMTVVRNAKVALSEMNVPKEGRYLVLTPHYANLVSEYMSDKLLEGQTARSGWVGRVEGFDVYESNRLPEDAVAGKVKLMFGHPEAITFANQIVGAEWIPSHPDYHGGAFKSLHVYGGKVFVPAALGRIEADIPA